MTQITMRPFIIISLLLIIADVSAQQDRYISGRIVDAVDNNPITGVYEETPLTTEVELSVEDELMDRFARQLDLFPQEKLYLHTDKPYYLSGERIWFRAYLADAESHVPFPLSRYVYAELINPMDSVVTRVKIRQDEEGAFHGYLPVPDDVPEGDYTLRAYTTFMQSTGENYFFTKTFRIGDPQSRAVHVATAFAFTPAGRGMERVEATFRFSRLSPFGLSDPFVPQSAKMRIGDRQSIDVNVAPDGTAHLQFDLPAGSRQQTVLLETMTSSNPYRQYIRIPMPDDDFDVTFYPEGGSLMEGVSCKVAFKAMKSNGQATHISGVIYDQNGTSIGTIRSDYLGMGSFVHRAERGNSCYVICENDKGRSKRFDLPVALDRGYALTVNTVRDRIRISVLQPSDATQNDVLYLLAHTRGAVHFVEPWDHTNNLMVIPKEAFPSGVLHLILFDAKSNPVSERLVFINNQDQAEATYRSDQANFVRRSAVNNRVALTDSDGEPVTGSFSVSVTSDRAVTADSTSNILTQLLLSSDLHGYIENPLYYFRNSSEAAFALDLLMCTQGWRRYDIAALAKGNYLSPSSPIEMGAEISGIVRSGLLRSQPAEGIEVTALSSQGGGYFNLATTDKDGRFSLVGGEIADSIGVLVTAMQGRGVLRNMTLTVDTETFPERTLFVVSSAEIDRIQFAAYADRAERQYVSEGGIREYELPEVTVTARKRQTGMSERSVYYSLANSSLTEEQLEKFLTTDWSNVLSRIPGVTVNGGNIIIRGMNTLSGTINPSLVVDGFLISEDCGLGCLESIIRVHEVAHIDVLKDGAAAVFGSRGGNGVISVFRKSFKISPEDVVQPPHIKAIFPLGYQQPVEFYAPKYDTSEKQHAPIPDLRTTIHWQPVVQTDNAGVASFEFYTADEPASYTVIIEGLTDDGKIIRQEEKLW